MSPKGPTSISLIFSNKLQFQKAQSGSPFTFYGTIRLFQNSHFPSEMSFSQYMPTNNFFNTIRIFDVTLVETA